MGRVYPDQKIVFVTGKGGVGKSSVAAALAINEARNGRRTLLVELAEQSYLSSIFAKPIGVKPTQIENNLDVALFKGDSCLRDFLLFYVRLESVVSLFFSNPVMASLVNAAPALKELAILGKVTSGLRGIGPDNPYDLVIVDSYATGHFKALMNVPKGMGEVVRFGPMGEQSRDIDKVLRNPEQCQFKIVTLAEELPVTEAIDLDNWLEQELGQSPGIICNRMIELPLPTARLQELAEGVANANQGTQDFVKYLNAVDGRQQASREKLQQHTELYLQVPMVYSSDLQERVEAIAKSVGLAWKS